MRLGRADTWKDRPIAGGVPEEEADMPDPKFAKPWHGVPRDEIQWWPTLNEDAWIGCGTRVVACGRQVYRFDFERTKAVVADPMNRMVGCTDLRRELSHQRDRLPVDRPRAPTRGAPGGAARDRGLVALPA